MNILALLANPENQVTLRLDRELRDIRQRLVTSGRKFSLDVRGAVRPEDLQPILLREHFDVIHFSGHGRQDGHLLLETADGGTSYAPVEGFADVIRELASGVQLVFLNSCFSAKQAENLAAVVPCVVGMWAEISDEVAVAFAASFYQAVASGQSVARAYRLAQIDVRILGFEERNIPALIQKAGVNADEVFISKEPSLHALFDLDRQKRPIKKGAEYSMSLFLEDVPGDVRSCVYQFVDDTIQEDDAFSESFDVDESFAISCSFYGDVVIRVTLWRGAFGQSFSCRLKDALRSSYKGEVSDLIAKAVEKISES